MVYRTRRKYSASDKVLLWDMWQRGESLNAIGCVFDRPSSCIYGLIAPSSGIRPPTRQRSRLALSLSEREEISRGIAAYLSILSIATQLARSPSTISREINRNGGYDHYRAADADQAAWNRARCPKPCKLACNRPLNQAVEANCLASSDSMSWKRKNVPGCSRIMRWPNRPCSPPRARRPGKGP